MLILLQAAMSQSMALSNQASVYPLLPSLGQQKKTSWKKNDFTVMHPVPEHIISRKKGCTILSQLTVRIE